MQCLRLHSSICPNFPTLLVPAFVFLTFIKINNLFSLVNRMVKKKLYNQLKSQNVPFFFTIDPYLFIYIWTFYITFLTVRLLGLCKTTFEFQWRNPDYSCWAKYGQCIRPCDGSHRCLPEWKKSIFSGIEVLHRIFQADRFYSL